MTIDEKYMRRCLQLALNGKGQVAPNPMVGAVIVHNNKIIGEGYHCEYGKAHAEVNAINSVKDKSLLIEATIYVSLEPCAHHGKTPPCSQLIINHNLKKVVVACLDPYPAVSGAGVKMIRDAGIQVEVGTLEKEAWDLNKEFFTAQTLNRPYIYLKWAQTSDGFIDKKRAENEKPQPTPISNSFTRMLVHKKRAEVAAIMIGTNTAIKDNPSLTTRYWYGKNPIRVIIDRQGRIPSDSTIFDNNVPTLIFTENIRNKNNAENITFIELTFDENFLDEIFLELRSRNINSILIEGGAQLLQTLINKGMWDEAYIETSDQIFKEGTKAPSIEGQVLNENKWRTSKQIHLRRS